MPRKSTGRVIPVDGQAGTTFALRFTAYGKRRYVTLGTEPEWTNERAEEELRHVLELVKRGTWQPRRTEPVEPERKDPTFHVFASEWFERTRHEWKPATVRAYRDELTLHLLPYFAQRRLTEITVEDVDRYRARKLAEWTRWRDLPAEKRRTVRQPIGPPTINKTLTRLGQVLEDAV